MISSDLKGSRAFKVMKGIIIGSERFLIVLRHSLTFQGVLRCSEGLT